MAVASVRVKEYTSRKGHFVTITLDDETASTFIGTSKASDAVLDEIVKGVKQFVSANGTKKRTSAKA